MSVEQFPRDQFHKVFNTGEIIKCGSFLPNNDCELKYLMNYFYIGGAIAGTEKFRTIIYSDSNYTSALYTSAWSLFSDIPGRGNNWQGWVRSDFSRQHLKAAREYFLGIEISGYTRNAFTFFISAKFDFDNAVYPKGSTQFKDYPIATRFYFYEEREDDK